MFVGVLKNIHMSVVNGQLTDDVGPGKIQPDGELQAVQVTVYSGGIDYQLSVFCNGLQSIIIGLEIRTNNFT